MIEKVYDEGIPNHLEINFQGDKKKSSRNTQLKAPNTGTSATSKGMSNTNTETHNARLSTKDTKYGIHHLLITAMGN